MARAATTSDLVKVMYEQIDALRKRIGVAPIRLALAEDGSARLKVSVREGMRDKVPASVTLKIKGELVEVPLLAVDDHE
jgi:hypothetical protein